MAKNVCCVLFTTIAILFSFLTLCSSIEHRRCSRASKGKPHYAYQWKTLYFDQKIDHFTINKAASFKQKFLINDSYYEDGGPIFFYTGNEGDIEAFANNTGWMWTYAPEFKALLIFVEHRYYGVSMPFGNESYSSMENRQYLTIEQALNDFVHFIGHFKLVNKRYADAKVVAFGGSYGGMLSAWARMKYPNVFDAALAASAPIWQFSTPCEMYSKIVTDDYRQFGGEKCVTNIRRSFTLMAQKIKTEKGRKQLAGIFKLCNNSDVERILGWFQGALSEAPMVNYPYASNFLQPLPAWPLKGMCSQIALAKNDEQVLQGAMHAVQVYFNHTGSEKCFNLDGGTDNLGATRGWNFQSCSEVAMAMCDTNTTDFFPPSPWDLTEFTLQCTMQYGPKVVLSPMRWATQFWGMNIEMATQIVFSNGMLDPWFAGGVTKYINRHLPIILIPMGAHHLDMRAPNPADPKSVKLARNLEVNYIKKWLGIDADVAERRLARLNMEYHRLLGSYVHAMEPQLVNAKDVGVF